MVMSENAPWSGPQMANGRFGDPPDHGADEVRSARVGTGDTRAVIFGRSEGGVKADDTEARGEPGWALRDASTMTVQGRQVEELLFSARSHADALAAQARDEAEELLSRAQAQAELLRVHAEHMRAEAEHMRAEAAALQAALSTEVEAAGVGTESAVSEARAAAEELRSAIQLEAAAARQQLEQVKAEATSIRRLLRAEVDAGLADAERLRGEVRRLCAETNKLAAELAMLLAGRAPDEPAAVGDHRARPPHDAPPAEPDDGASPVGDEGLGRSSGELEPMVGPTPHAEAPELDRNMAELLQKLWDAAFKDGSPTSETPANEFEEPSVPWGGRGASQPLIGSGGWQAKDPAAPELGTDAGDETTMQASGRRRRRFHRG